MAESKTREMPKAFDFRSTEQRLYQWWEENGWFKPEIAPPDAEPYVISIPPPNVTGALHQGHALFVAIEDLMIRHARMKGFAALWVPGTDHAGIATQLQVEKLLQSEGTSRQEVGREEFLRRTWEWKEKYGSEITRQLRRLGASADWDRERFTLDDGLSRAVREAFVRWYEQGLIYRGTYMINWSPKLQTAVSDLEVEREERTIPLYYFKYRLKDSDEFIPVATVRPETILGDTAVAVHPEDDRYKKYIGKMALVPMLDREIPVIADEYVDREFGTGALKITPAHDPNDYEIGLQHNLPSISILNKDATLNEEAGPYAGMDRFAARKKLWADMESAGLTIKTEQYTTTLPISQRGGELIEPMISTQWFVHMTGPANAALQVVRDGEIKIVPERFGKTWEHWLTDIKDWCISRQLWWGHRIPAWHCADCGQITVARQDPTECQHCGSANIEQDPDVLDTWFSSGLWPFSTLGWPDETPDLKRFYPTTMMETGYDILFFWVARMVMMGLSFTEEPPFKTIYLHGLVRDEHGKKMSKTAGNVIDPLELMEEYGTDALRFTLLTGSAPGNDMNLSVERVAGNRNFANKIWNAARFLVSNVEGADIPFTIPAREGLSLPDRWILSRLHHLIETVDRLFESHLYGEAGRQVYDFLWGEYADWYIEIAKTALYGENAEAKQRTLHILTYVLDQCLRLLHPFIPYVTEEIWQHIPHQGEALIIARWPEMHSEYFDTEAEEQMVTLIEIIRGIRNIRAEYDVPPGRRIEALISAGEWTVLLENQRETLVKMATLESASLRIERAIADPPQQAATTTVGGITVYLPLAGLVDLAAERTRLQKEMDNLNAQIERSEKLLGDDNFAARAPAQVVQRERDKLETLRLEHSEIEKRLQSL
jgi:valyl-tRNA synthetase